MEIDIVLFYNQIKLLCICFRLSPVGMKFENKSRGFLLGSPAFKLADELEFFRIMCRDQRIQRIVGMPKPMVDDDMGGFLIGQLLISSGFPYWEKLPHFFPPEYIKNISGFRQITRALSGRFFPHHCMAAVNSAKAFPAISGLQVLYFASCFFSTKAWE